MAILEAMALGSVLGATQHIFSGLEGQQAQKYYEQNQKMNFDLSQKAQQNAVANQAIGLRKAGLNPASVAQGQVAPSPIASAPLQSKNASMPSFPIQEILNAEKQDKILDAQVANINAQTDKLKAEEHNLGETGVNLERINNMNRDIDGTYREQIKANHPDLWKRYVDSVGDEATAEERFTASAFQAFVGYNRDLADLYHESARQGIEKTIAQSPDLQQTIASMPLYERNKLISEMTYLNEQATTQQSLRDKLASDVKLQDSQRQEIAKRIDKIGQDIDESKGRLDLMTSEKFRNYAVGAGVAMNGVSNLVKEIMDIATGGKFASAEKVGEAFKGSDLKSKYLYLPDKPNSKDWSKGFTHFPLSD